MCYLVSGWVCTSWYLMDADHHWDACQCCCSASESAYCPGVLSFCGKGSLFRLLLALFLHFFNLNSQLPLSWLEVCLHNVIIFICHWRVLYILLVTWLSLPGSYLHLAVRFNKCWLLEYFCWFSARVCHEIPDEIVGEILISYIRVYSLWENVMNELMNIFLLCDNWNWYLHIVPSIK